MYDVFGVLEFCWGFFLEYMITVHNEAMKTRFEVHEAV